MTTILYGLIEGRPGNPNVGLPFYVGIGSLDRPKQHLRQARRPEGCRNRLLNLVIRDHLAIGIEPLIEMIATFETRAEADTAERAAIIQFGRLGRDADGILCNVARGGDGPDPSLMQDPTILAKISAASKRHFESPQARERVGDASRKRWSDAEFKEKRIEALRIVYADPAVIARVSAATEKALNSPEIRERHLAALARVNGGLTSAQRSAAAAKKSPEAVAASIAALRAAHADLEIESKRRANSREPQKNSWADPEIRARRIAAMKGKKKTLTPEAIAARQANARLPKSDEARSAAREASLRNWADPTFRAARSASQAAAWSDPEKRANMLAGRSEGIAETWRDPETRQKRIAGIKAAAGREDGH